MTAPAPWLDAAKRLDLGQVCAAMGLQTRAGRRLEIQCPACGEVKRSSSSPDRRLAAEARGEGHWHCWRCHAGGDVVDIVSFRLAGGKFAGQAQVREWFSGPLEIGQAQAVQEVRLDYPPGDEVRALWERAGAVVPGSEVGEWMQRRIGPLWVRVAPLVRVMPEGWLPGWARFQGQSWQASGHRALFPVWDALGRLRAVRARRVAEGEGPKCVPPAPLPTRAGQERHPGFAHGGLVLACPVALRVLRGQAPAPGWPAVVPVVVTEGEPAWMAWTATRKAAVLGLTSGSWSLALADRIPFGTRVLVATDHDRAGDRYAAMVIESLRGRCEITRWSADAAAGRTA